MIDTTEDPLNSNSTNNFTISVHIDEDIKISNDVLTIIMVTSIMMSMGADICWKQIWMHVRRPIGPVIALICQFVMMPLTGFVYNKLFKFQTELAAGLLIISCCPGGAVSNVFAYYLDGDVSLSVTMTTVSTILALGMMPLNVWIYAIRTESNALVIPYKNIALSLVIITSPVLIGMAIRWKAPKISVYVTKVGSAVGIVLLLTVLILDFITFRDLLRNMSWKLILTSILMPISGIAFGYLIAFISKRSSAVCRTIAIESGIQNAAVAFSVIVLSFDIRKYTTILLIPWFYGLFQCVVCSLLCFIYHLGTKYCVIQQTTESTVQK